MKDMDHNHVKELIALTAGKQPDSLQPVSGGLSNAGKFKARVFEQDWMVKILPGNAVRDLWYKELAIRSDDRMACPKMHHLFEDGTLCLMSPWIDGESLEERLLNGNKKDLQRFGEQAAQILLKLHQTPFEYPGYVKQLQDRVYRACTQVEELQLTFPEHEQCCDFLRKSVNNYGADHVCFVHKDIRPENFVVKDEQLYLIDFDNGSLGERATDFSYLTTMGGEQFFPFSREVLQTYLTEIDSDDFWKKNLLYSTLQVVEYAIWKYQAKGKQVKLQADNLCVQYDDFTSVIPMWWNSNI